MSGKIVNKIIAVILVVCIIAVVKESVFDNKSIASIVGALMGELPFAKKIYDLAAKVIGYSKNVPEITEKSFLKDFIKLLVMAILQPWIVGGVSKLFLRLPSGRNQIISLHRRQWEAEEAYCGSAGYRIKKLLVAVVTAPLIAVLSSQIIAWLMDSLSVLAVWQRISKQGYLIILLVFFLFVVLFVLSIYHLWASFGFVTAVLYRFVITICGGLANSLVINCLCLLLYISILKGSQMGILGSVGSLLLWLVIYDIALKCIRRAIVS